MSDKDNEGVSKIMLGESCSCHYEETLHVCSPGHPIISSMIEKPFLNAIVANISNGCV